MPVPVTPSHSPVMGRGGPICEVDLETFSNILRKTPDRPIVLARQAKIGGYTYVTRYGGYYFILKQKAPHDFTRHADVIPIRKFFQYFGMSAV